MKTLNQKVFAELNDILTRVRDLELVGSLLHWDQNTYLPSLAVEHRARQIATVGALSHELFISPHVGSLLDQLKQDEYTLDFDSFEASLLRVVRRQYEKSLKLPTEFINELLQHQSVCYSAWIEAKQKNDFAIVQPFLEKTLEYSKRYCEFFEYKHIADPLIAENDFGFTVESVKETFEELREILVPLSKKIAAKYAHVDDSCLKKNFPIELQKQLCHELVQELGYDFARGRIDTTYHPFMIRLGDKDIRITTRYKENDLSEALYSTIHEAGHALYELGISEDLAGTQLANGTSSGVHESQSRLWENIVARSHEYCHYLHPKLQKYFPEAFSTVTIENFYGAVNKVVPSLIRTDADEVTYNLHVMIRFDLEMALLEGKLQVRDLPEAWNARYTSDLGVTPRDLASGCLQDVHWFGGMIGGQFQGYTLGNIMAAQFFEAATHAVPDIQREISQGNFTGLRTWLTENLYTYGAKFSASEILFRATKKKLTIAPYITYLKTKYS